MFAAMDSAELSRWYVRWRSVAPFGDEWRQFGMLASVVANTSANRTKDSKIFGSEDFMPLVRTPEAIKAIEQSEQEQKELAKVVHDSLGYHG